jgi:PAS domain S-box-containing protein
MRDKYYYLTQTALLLISLFFLSYGSLSIANVVLAVALGVCFLNHQATKQKINFIISSLDSSTKLSADSALERIAQKLQAYKSESAEMVSAITQLGYGESAILVKGKAGEALGQLKAKLASLKKEEEQRVWAVQGQAMLGEIRNREENLTSYSFQVISHLIKYVKANQGGFYILNENNGDPFLQLLSAYAYGKRKFSDKEIKVEAGQGLLGQCVLEKDIIYLTAVPTDYVKITSGLGEATPRCVTILPLLFHEQLLGVIEMASFQVFEKNEMEFLRKVSENIGAELYSIKSHENTRKLLEKSQELSSEMRSQEEEMSQNMEEMQATQEEMSRKQAELTGVFDSINRAMGAVEFSLSGTLISHNSTFQKYLAMPEVELKKKDLAWICGGLARTEKIQAAIARGESYTEEYPLYIDNKNTWLNATFNPVEDSKGELQKILMLAQDVTVKKEKEKEFETLSLVADNTDNSVVITDDQGKIVYVNNGFTRLTGYTLQECAGKKPGSFLQGPETDKETVKRVSAKLKLYESIYEEILNYAKDGRSYWISMVINPLKDSDGKIEKYISIQADITETKQRALDFHHKLDSISRTNAMIEFDQTGKIIEVNDFFLKVTEFEKVDLMGKSYEVLIPESERTKPQTEVMWRNLLVGQAFTGEFKCADAIGKEQWVSGTYNPIFDLHGKLIKIMMLGQFVTEDKKKQQELKQYVNILKQSFPVFEINNKLQLQSCNEKFLSLTKLRRIEFSRKKIEEVFTENSVIDLAKILQSTAEVSFHSVDLAVRNGSQPHIYHSSISLVKDQFNQTLRAIIILKSEELEKA